MAKIIEGRRRIIKLSVDDILHIIKTYQQLTHNSFCYEHTREILSKNNFFLPEDVD